MTRKKPKGSGLRDSTPKPSTNPNATSPETKPVFVPPLPSAFQRASKSEQKPTSVNTSNQTRKKPVLGLPPLPTSWTTSNSDSESFSRPRDLSKAQAASRVLNDMLNYPGIPVYPPKENAPKPTGWKYDFQKLMEIGTAHERKLDTEKLEAMKKSG